MLYCFRVCKHLHRALIGTHVLHKIYPRVFFEQINFRVLAELNTSEITHIACAHTYHYTRFSFKFKSSCTVVIKIFLILLQKACSYCTVYLDGNVVGKQACKQPSPSISLA